MRRLALIVSALMAVGLVVVPGTPAAAELHGIRGTYSAIEGALDTPTVIRRLRELNANTYLYFVDGQADWDRLQIEVAPAAQEAGINVWVYLRGPGCEVPNCHDDYLPFRDRYEEWARSIAWISRVYPVVTAFVINDFANRNNLDFMTPSYVRRIRDAAAAVQPTLKFYPILYYRFLVQESFLDDYASLFDAAIMPYDDHPFRNTFMVDSLRGQLDNASASLARHGRKLMLMPYAGALSNTQVFPDVEYVRLITAIGMEYAGSRTIAGVVQYSLPLEPGHPERKDRNFSRSTGTGALVATRHDREHTSAGDWGGARAQIRFEPGSTVCRMRFWHYDNRAAPTTTGRHFKQAWVNGHVVWEQDVATDDVDWFRTGGLELTQYLQANEGSATLILRLFEKQASSGNRVLAIFDDLTFTGCTLLNQDPGFERARSWVPARFGGPVLAGQHNYDPIYSTNVFNAVSRLYG